MFQACYRKGGLPEISCSASRSTGLEPGKSDLSEAWLHFCLGLSGILKCHTILAIIETRGKLSLRLLLSVPKDQQRSRAK